MLLCCALSHLQSTLKIYELPETRLNHYSVHDVELVLVPGPSCTSSYFYICPFELTKQVEDLTKSYPGSQYCENLLISCYSETPMLIIFSVSPGVLLF